MHVSRREWMLALACWTEALRAQSASQQRLAWFDQSAADEIVAIIARIIPDDDTPGAVRAGVIWFIDSALAGYDRDKQELYREGLAETQSKRAAMFPGSQSIAGLAADQQIALLQAIEKTDFFQQVRQHAVLGFLGHPMHGGNRDMVGWHLIGVEHQMRYEPPFGYYDAESSRGEAK